VCSNFALQNVFESFLPINILQTTSEVNAHKQVPLYIKWSPKVSDRNENCNSSKKFLKFFYTTLHENSPRISGYAPQHKFRKYEKITIFYIFLEFPLTQYHEIILITVSLYTKDKKQASKDTSINLK